MTQPHRRARGFSLIETLISMLLVAVLLVAALQTVGATVHSRHASQRLALGTRLAQDLMTEILAQSYDEPDDAPSNDFWDPGFTGDSTSIGRDSSESGGDRADWDDVDDYDGWTSEPPQTKAGVPLPEYAGWVRAASIDWAVPLEPDTGAFSPTRLKRITVTASFNGVTVAEAIALRSSAWPNPEPASEPIQVLLVVTDPTLPLADETLRQQLIENEGHVVTTIDDGAADSDFLVAIQTAEVVYLSSAIDASAIAPMLAGESIGIVSEHLDAVPALYLCDSTPGNDMTARIVIADNGHPITIGFPPGDLIIAELALRTHKISTPFAPGAQRLAQTSAGDPTWLTMLALDAGSEQADPSGPGGGGPSPGRRVQLPWGQGLYSVSQLTDNARTIMLRSVEWAANRAP